MMVIPPAQEKRWHPDFSVDTVTVEAVLAALEAAHAALPPLEAPPPTSVDVNAVAATATGVLRGSPAYEKTNQPLF